MCKRTHTFAKSASQQFINGSRQQDVKVVCSKKNVELGGWKNACPTRRHTRLQVIDIDTPYIN